MKSGQGLRIIRDSFTWDSDSERKDWHILIWLNLGTGVPCCDTGLDGIDQIDTRTFLLFNS